MSKCQHTDCNRIGARVISHEEPHHTEFRGQTHQCCGNHTWEFEVGDRVYEDFGGRFGNFGAIKTVDRKTKTQYVVGDRRYRISDLREVGWTGTGSGFRSAPELISAEGTLGDGIRRNKIISDAQNKLESTISEWQKKRADPERLMAIRIAVENLIKTKGETNV